jgi:hypothetical protein
MGSNASAAEISAALKDRLDQVGREVAAVIRSDVDFYTSGSATRRWWPNCDSSCTPTGWVLTTCGRPCSSWPTPARTSAGRPGCESPSGWDAVRSRKARAETDQLATDAANAAIRSADAESQAAAALARLTAVHEEQARIRSAEKSAEREAAGTAPIWYLQRQDEFHVLHNVSNGPASMSPHLVTRYSGPGDLLGARSIAAHRS